MNELTKKSISINSEFVFNIYLVILVVGIILAGAIAIVDDWLYPTQYYSPMQISMTQVAQCEATEEFTRDQCVILVGDGR